MTFKEKKIKKATEAFCSGLNCSQSTAVPFAEDVGMDEKTVLNAMAAFGGGVARLREVCGVVSGITFIVGLYEDADFSDPKEKERAYTVAQGLIQKFVDKHETFNCGELIDYLDKSPVPSERTEEYYKERPCALLVEDGAAIICDYMGIE